MDLWEISWTRVLGRVAWLSTPTTTRLLSEWCFILFSFIFLYPRLNEAGQEFYYAYNYLLSILLYANSTVPEWRNWLDCNVTRVNYVRVYTLYKCGMSHGPTTTNRDRVGSLGKWWRRLAGREREKRGSSCRETPERNNTSGNMEASSVCRLLHCGHVAFIYIYIYIERERESTFPGGGAFTTRIMATEPV